MKLTFKQMIYTLILALGTMYLGYSISPMFTELFFCALGGWYWAGIVGNFVKKHTDKDQADETNI